QHRLRADISGRRAIARSRRHARPESRAGPARPAAGRLALLDVLPLLPRSRRSQHSSPLRRAHAYAQADLFLEEGSVGAVRSRQRSVRAQQPVWTARPGEADRGSEGRARAVEEGSRRRRPARKRTVAERRGRTGREAAREVATAALFLKNPWPTLFLR